MVEADPGRRPGSIQFNLGQTFYDKRHFRDVLKEFFILNNFRLKHIKQIIEMLRLGASLKIACGVYTSL